MSLPGSTTFLVILVRKRFFPRNTNTHILFPEGVRVTHRTHKAHLFVRVPRNTDIRFLFPKGVVPRNTNTHVLFSGRP